MFVLGYTPTKAGIDLNELNSELRLRLMQNADFMVSRSNIGEAVVLRSVISNPGITEQTLDEFLAEVVRIGTDVENGLPRESMY